MPEHKVTITFYIDERDGRYAAALKAPAQPEMTEVSMRFYRDTPFELMTDVGEWLQKSSIKYLLQEWAETRRHGLDALRRDAPDAQR